MTRKPSLLLAAPAILALALATAGPVSAHFPRFKNHKIVPGKSIGGLKVGMNKRQARKAWGKPDKIDTVAYKGFTWFQWTLPVDIGTGTPLLEPKIGYFVHAGKVAVVHSMFPFDLVTALTERGIAGLVHVCETPEGIVGNFTGALYPPPLEPPWHGRPTAYPGVTISHPDGRVLISELGCGRPVEIGLSHQGAYRERTAHNVVGRVAGSRPGEVILSAHYDSQAEGPCVYDNGSGLSSLLETGRALHDGSAGRTIVLLASACEEIGVWGASAYVHAPAREMEDVVGMINLDGIASAYPSERQIWCADAHLLELAVETADAHGWGPHRAMHARSTFSDHAPFTDAGVPACLIWRPDYPYYQSRGDVRALVDEHAVAETASVSASLAYRLSIT